MNKEEFYSMVETRDDWSFANVPRSETKEITHSYHKYPAKFIPQLARAFINEYTEEGGFIWDSFCGSGTLNLEALRNNRNSVGTDINPVAVLISRVKTTSLDPEKLEIYIEDLVHNLETKKVYDERYYVRKGVLNGNLNVLKAWFSEESLIELGHILWHIKKLDYSTKYREFGLCAFSSILKRSSYWLSSSIKSQKDPDKKPEEPLLYLKRQLNSMKKANKSLYDELMDNTTQVRIFRHNSKHRLPKSIKKFDCIITSPPYVVSYDYSDIFRLSTYFLFYQEDYRKFRETFIGTPLIKKRQRGLDETNPELHIINSINNAGLKKGLAEYYGSMGGFFYKSRFHIKKDGLLVMVIGDTALRGVEIPNAYLLSKIAEMNGWCLENAYEREVPVKILPTSRDPITGKFTSKQNGNYSKRYEKEYILVFRVGSS